MSTSASNSVYVDLLKESEEFCKRNSLPTYSDFIRTHDGSKKSTQYKLDDRYRLTWLMQDAPYFEELMFNDTTGECKYRAFCYCDDKDKASPVYMITDYVKPEEGLGELTTEFISIEEFNRFFDTASTVTIKNFKCLKPFTPTFINLLKASEGHCEKNNLTTMKTLETVCRDLSDDKNRAVDVIGAFINGRAYGSISEKTVATIIAAMKNAAYYERTSYEPPIEDEIRHLAYCYNKDSHRLPVFSMVYYERAARLDFKYCNVVNFSFFLANKTAEQIKNFKCLQDNQVKKE